MRYNRLFVYQNALEAAIRQPMKKLEGACNVAYHYTNQSGLIGILRSVTIRATDVRFLNDSVEFTYGTSVFEYVIKEREKERHIPRFKKDDLYQTLKLRPRYAASFSQDGDSLSQWGMYGQFALGWELEKLASICLATRTLTMLSPCLYLEEEQHAVVNTFVDENLKALDSGIIDESIFASNLANFWGWCGSFFKHPSFAQERELRLITFLPSEDYTSDSEQGGIAVRWGVREGPLHPIPFVSIGIPSPSCVVIGPGQSDLALDVVQEMLKASNLVSTNILRSKLPFRQ